MGDWDETVVAIEDAVVVAKTSRAILCSAEMLEDIDKKDRWIPFSQIDFASEINRGSKEGDAGYLVISSWIAEQKGIV